MNTVSLFRKISFLLVLSGMSFIDVGAAPCAGTLSWSGSITSADNADDMNVTLDSATITVANDGVRIRACNCDVGVTMSSDVTIAGSGSARLYLEVNNGRTITFSLDNNLTFKGELLIVARGTGTVIFEIDGGSKLALEPGDNGGVKFFVCMQDSLQVCFDRTETNPDDHAQVCIGASCLLSYVAENDPVASNEVGTIKWDPTNSGAGRFILNVENQGAVVIRGCKITDCFKTDLLLSDIDCKVTAGKNAIMSVANTSDNCAPAGMLVVNSNEAWPELLIDPFCNLGAEDDIIDYNGTFTGPQYGFILGANATFTVLENAYLDYVALTSTVCTTTLAPSLLPEGQDIDEVLKPRNPSAFIIDGSYDPNTSPAKINLANQAAIYFRSGIDYAGTVRPITDPHPFTIDPALRTPGAGIPVMHVEGPLDVCGANLSATSPSGMQSMIEVLSWEVAATGGPLFVGTSETIFPLRTFAQLDGEYYQYNAANIMFNNCVNLFNVALKHTDEIHKVVEKNDAVSEPTYVGGDTAVLKDRIKSQLAFHNSVLLVHTDVAFTGFDLIVPNGINPSSGACIDNTSSFYFFQNGKKIDQGTGRQMILGTVIGSYACDACKSLCSDAQLDVMQTSTCTGGSSLTHELQLKVQANNNTINEDITTDISGQTAVHTLYLGQNSNISVGTQDDSGLNMGTDKDGNMFALTTKPKFSICGNFFSFETKGGSLGIPSASNITGQGGIFVDYNGTFCLADSYRAYFGAMITKSTNGIIDVSRECALFSRCTGLADWNVDLATDNILIPYDQNVSDYTLNWMFMQKDYDGGFLPYETTDCGGASCASVVSANLINLPEIRGTVEQLQLKGSRLGDQAQVFINGGYVRELVHCIGHNSAEAPVALVVLDNGGRLGIGSASKNLDSQYAASKLGINGVTIVANGGGVVELNDNLIIDNDCAILAGPGFSSGGALRIGSTQGKTLTLKSGVTLDLRSFVAGQTIELFGDVQFVIEPGARILFNNSVQGGTLRLKDRVRMLFEPAVNPYSFDSTVDLPESTLDFPASCVDSPAPFVAQQALARRAVLAGQGKIEVANCASISIPRGADVGVESCDACGIDITNLQLEIQDNGLVTIGDDRDAGFGGGLQIGNTSDVTGSSVSFELILNGDRAAFEVGAQGFLGLAVGCVCKSFNAPNNWRVMPLYNVSNLTLNLTNGTFKHAHVWTGSDELASLVAMSAGASTTPVTYTVTVSEISDEDGHLSRTSILGGGNIVNIAGAAGVINPVVGDDDGTIDANYSASVLASTRNIAGTSSGSTAANVFSFVKLKAVTESQPVTGKAVASQNQRNHKLLNAVWILDNKIGRQPFENMITMGGKLIAHQQVKLTGSVSIGLAQGATAPSQLQYVVESL